MIGLVRAITTLIVALLIQGGVSGAVEMEPAEAVDEFMDGLMSGDKQMMELYMDNDYVNFLANAEGDEEELSKMNEALFKNLEYESADVASKGGAAVVKLKVKTNDFSGVMEEYEKVSYDYVMDNLYEEKVTDKSKLSKECLEMYVDQIEKAAKADASLETEVYLPMINDGYGRWKMLLDDKIMKALMGNLDLPE